MSQSNIRLPPKWIELNITKRECTTFIAAPQEDTLCQCGRRKIDHGDFTKHQHRPETWSPTLHTKTFHTDAYGTILFEGEHHPNKAHYVRLSYDTDPEIIVQLMTYVWNLEMPQLLISLRGGSTNFSMSHRLGKIFQSGITKAARSTNAWVFSNGLHSGAAKHLGFALGHEKFLGGPKRRRVVSVGIAPWGMIENRNDLLGRNKDRTYSPLDLANPQFLQLNSRHSNFLLVDNGSIGKFGGENYLRRRLEKCISSYPTSPNRGCDTPVVVIVVEGGFYTLRQVSDYLYDEPPIPVVIFAGSGRAADLIAWTIRKVESEENFDAMKSKIRQKIKHLFQISSDFQCSMLYQELRNIFVMKSLVTVYNPNSSSTDEDFDAVILSSIFRSQHLSPLEQLSLSLVWNRVDIAQTEVFIYGRDWSRDHLEHAMMEALVSNRLDFVTLLLEHGLNMQTFLTASRLESLYSLERMPSKLMRTLLAEISKMRRKRLISGAGSSNALSSGRIERNLTLHDIGIALSHMIGHVYKSSYIHLVAKIHKKQGGAADEHEVRAQTFLQPFDDLFIWAVLTKRHEMSKLLWRHGKGALAKALVAVKLNKYMAVEINVQEKSFSTVAVDFENYADEWETLSLSLLDSCYRTDSKMARQLLTMELESWSKQTCLTLGVMAYHRSLLGHPCCQQLLADLWMGAIKIKSHVTLKIVLGVLFPPCALLWEYKSNEELRLLPHQGKSGYAFQAFRAGVVNKHDVVGDDGAGLHHIQRHCRPQYHIPHGHRNCTERSASSLMTLLIQNKSNYIHDTHEYENEPNDEREETAELSVVVKNVPVKNGSGEKLHQGNIGISPEPMQLKPRYHYHNHHILPLVHNPANIPEELPPVQTSREKDPFCNTPSCTDTMDIDTERAKRHSFVTTKQSLGVWNKFIEFQSAPVTNFYRHMIGYLAFIIALSYVILYPQDENFPGWVEFYVIAYFGTQYLECLREFIEIDALSLAEKFASIQQNVWQFGDLLMVCTCLFCGVVLRFTPGYFEYGMLIYRLSSIYWNLRLYKYLGVHRFLGPKLVMMRRMLKHMVHFAMIIVVVIISFGIARAAIRFPKTSPTVKDLAEAFLEPYMMMFGEVDLDTLSLKCDDEDNDGTPDCVSGHWIVPITWVVYMLVANILIVNVLIAVFNGIYDEVDSIAVEVWMFQRFNFVMEFEHKPLLPPPFIILCHAVTLLKFIYGIFLSWACEEELLMETDMDEELHAHIIMGNDHSLKSFLSPGEQSMVFDFEEENVDSLTPLLDKESNPAGMSIGNAAGGTNQSTNTNVANSGDTSSGVVRLGLGSEKFALQQIKMMVGEMQGEMDSQKTKVDKLISCLEREREELLGGNRDDDNDDDTRTVECTNMNCRRLGSGEFPGMQDTSMSTSSFDDEFSTNDDSRSNL